MLKINQDSVHFDELVYMITGTKTVTTKKKTSCFSFVAISIFELLLLHPFIFPSFFSSHLGGWTKSLVGFTKYDSLVLDSVLG